VDLLTEDAEQGDDRSMFYLAQSYRFLGEHELAREWYLSRAKAGGFEEERWLAQCWVKRYDLDVDGLIKCHKQRPWRHEPLTWAARIVAERPNDDRLFREPTP
jgi:hypothetical protein